MLLKLLGISENLWTFEKICWDAYMGPKFLGVILNSSLSLTLHEWWARKSYLLSKYIQTWPHLAPPLTPRWSQPPAASRSGIPATGLCCCHDTLSLLPVSSGAPQNTAVISCFNSEEKIKAHPWPRSQYSVCLSLPAHLLSPSHTSPDPLGSPGPWSFLFSGQRYSFARDLPGCLSSSFRLWVKWHLWCLA